MVVLVDDETINEAGEVIASEMREEEDDHSLECGSMGLFVEVKVSWAGQNCPSTLCIEGRLNGVTLGVLIDSGANQSFISPHVVVALELKVVKRKLIGVYLRDGHKVSTVGKCEKLDIQLGEFSTTMEPCVGVGRHRHDFGSFLVAKI
ncbi:hypothetical protein V8G54_022525 [Vigna mungo]|uniref:Uncharacterized protein n=1 Tax=Vigna mungo TaxID=3915 RepID=A0AAQ3RND5_VIGMU